jgi:hypothetical protein
MTRHRSRISFLQRPLRKITGRRKRQKQSLQKAKPTDNSCLSASQCRAVDATTDNHVGTPSFWDDSRATSVTGSRPNQSAIADCFLTANQSHGILGLLQRNRSKKWTSTLGRRPILAAAISRHSITAQFMRTFPLVHPRAKLTSSADLEELF